MPKDVGMGDCIVGPPKDPLGVPFTRLTLTHRVLCYATRTTPYPISENSVTRNVRLRLTNFEGARLNSPYQQRSSGRLVMAGVFVL